MTEKEFSLKEHDFGRSLEHSDLYFLTRQQALACICMLEIGGARIDPSYLYAGFAVSAGNSIFVAECILSDPGTKVPQHAIRRIVGILGIPGIHILISPEELQVKKQTEDFRAIEHAPYDFKREDNFRGVSLHLSPTSWKIPVPLTSQPVGNIDQDLFLAEAVVSVRDKGHWYADIDILKAVSPSKQVVKARCRCGKKTQRALEDYTSIDTFEELLDPPETPGVVRAYKNWPARLAACCIVRQKLNANGGIILPDGDIECWSCLKQEVSDWRRDSDDEPPILID